LFSVASTTNPTTATTNTTAAATIATTTTTTTATNTATNATTSSATTNSSSTTATTTPEGHIGHICVVIRATHDMRPTGRMYGMPDIEYVFFVQNVFYTWK
jgi:hypothetical protein